MVAGNWKMNTSRQSGIDLAKAVAASVTDDLVDVVVCPPFPYLIPVGESIAGTRVGLGAQNLYHENPGAFTGEVALGMLKDVGCKYVVIGHSERRHVLGETNELINKKIVAALNGGLVVLFCIGELLSERQANQTDAVLNNQLTKGLAGVSAESLSKGNLIIAYEPVWAIGTGVVATNEQAEEAHRGVRAWLQTHYNAEVAEKMRILYGGSVKASNAAGLLSQPNVDGALVGGASLKTEEFVPIIQAARR